MEHLKWQKSVQEFNVYCRNMKTEKFLQYVHCLEHQWQLVEVHSLLIKQAINDCKEVSLEFIRKLIKFKLLLYFYQQVSDRYTNAILG